MRNWEIYLTRSREVAYMLHNQATCDSKKLVSVSSGCVHQDCRIPALYHGDKWFYCIFEYEDDIPRYKLTIA